MLRSNPGKAGVWVVLGLLIVGLGLAIFAKSQRPAPPPRPPSPPGAPSQNPSGTPVLPLPPPPSGPLAILRGRVVFVGEIPARARLEITKDNEVCECVGGDREKREPYKLDESLVVDADSKGIANAVVWVEGIPVRTPRLEVVVDQRGCQFIPHVALLTPGGGIQVLNPDRIAHNFHWWSTVNPSGNRTIPAARPFLVVTDEGGFRKPEFIRVSCDLHGWMRMWIAVVDSGAAAVTDGKGAFSLPSVPSGPILLKVWHETLAPESVEIRKILAPEGGEVEIPLSKP